MVNSRRVSFCDPVEALLVELGSWSEWSQLAEDQQQLDDDEHGESQTGWVPFENTHEKDTKSTCLMDENGHRNLPSLKLASNEETFPGCRPFDVLFGRGRPYVCHPGNRRFRVIIDMYAERYNGSGCRQYKMELTQEIVNLIKQAGGRFLSLDEDSNEWVETDDERARRKTGETLRRSGSAWRRSISADSTILFGAMRRRSSLSRLSMSSINSQLTVDDLKIADPTADCTKSTSTHPSMPPPPALGSQPLPGDVQVVSSMDEHIERHLTQQPQQLSKQYLLSDEEIWSQLGYDAGAVLAEANRRKNETASRAA